MKKVTSIFTRSAQRDVKSLIKYVLSELLSFIWQLVNITIVNVNNFVT